MIKVRAWDASRNTMMTSPMQFTLKSTTDGELSGVNYSRGGMHQTLPLMLCTHCKDSAGTEIYEGDIITDGHFVWQVYRHADIFLAKLISHNNPVLKNMQLSLVLEQRNNAKCPVTVISNKFEYTDYDTE